MKDLFSLINVILLDWGLLSENKSMRILITGVAPFVGRWFTSRLVSDGHEVTVVNNLIQSGGGLDLDLNDWFSGSPYEGSDFGFVREDCNNFSKKIWRVEI